MNKQHQEVQVWLEGVFGDKSVPAYEVNQYTVGILHNIMRRNCQKEKDTQLLIEDCRQKAEEYCVESRRLDGILQRLNLTVDSLSQSGVMSIRTLANVALTLNTKDASDTSLLLALHHLDEEIQKVEEARRSQQKLLTKLQQKNETAALKHSVLNRALEELERKVVEEQPVLEKYARETQFLRNKTKEYRSQAQKIESHLDTTGVDPSLYHRTLQDRAEDLERLKQEIIPMKKKLDSYHGLPPDAIQAHMRLDELKEKVAALDEELTNRMDLLKV